MKKDELARNGILKDISEADFFRLLNIPLSENETPAGRIEQLMDLIVGTSDDCECDGD